jgi:hypothetical protein
MPIVATGEFDLLDMVVLLCFIAPSKHHLLEKREHGRTIPLADTRGTEWLFTAIDMCVKTQILWSTSTVRYYWSCN